MRFQFKIYIIGLSWLSTFYSCNKYVEVEPPTTSVTNATAFRNDATAAAVLTGIYTGMSSGNNFFSGPTSVSLLSGLLSDELTLYSGSFDVLLSQSYTNSLTNESESYSFWQNL